MDGWITSKIDEAFRGQIFFITKIQCKVMLHIDTVFI